MGRRSKIKKAEREVELCVEKLKKSIKEQYGISFEEWMKMKKEELHDNKHRESGT